MQETHCTKANEALWANEWGGNAFFSNGEGNARGVTILVNRDLYCDFISQVNNENGRIICASFKIEGAVVSFINVYAPNKDSPKFVQNIEEITVNTPGHKVVLGDFNVALECQLDRHGTVTNNIKMQSALKEFLENNYLVDNLENQKSD